MSTKRKLTVGSMDEPVDTRGRRQPFFLQANVPKAGLLWGVAGSAETILDRSSDIAEICEALEEFDENGNAKDWSYHKLEHALIELMDKCHELTSAADFERMSAEDFFFSVKSQVPWAKDNVSAGIIMEVCLKLMAARRAYRNSNRKFRHLSRARKTALGHSIDRFSEAVNPIVSTMWIETYLVPVEGEQADDEMEDPPILGRRRTAEEKRSQKRRITKDRLHAPTTPPGRLHLESGMSRGWANAGHYAPAKLTKRKENTEEAPASPSKRRSRSNSSDEDVEMLVGNMADDANDAM